MLICWCNRPYLKLYITGSTSRTEIPELYERGGFGFGDRFDAQSYAKTQYCKSAEMENSDDQFSLKWNNFQSNLATGFHDLLQEEDMVDVTLAAEGKFLQAHKIILSVCSPYFKDLFKMNPCKHPIVILKDVGHQELADMLDFMYRGEASVRQEDLAAFLKLAETLKVKGLAGDKGPDDTTSSTHQSQRKPNLVSKKKKIVEATVYETEDDPGDPDFNPGGSEPKRKRKRVSSPPLKTDNTSTSATSNSFVPLTNPKQEVQDQEEVEFLDDSATDPLVQFITGKQTKQEDSNDFEDSNQDMAGDETHDGEMDMTAGPSNADDTTEQLPQGPEEKTRKFMVQTPIWGFFKKTTTSTGDVRAICAVCEKSLRFHNTSVMVRHLRYLHPEEYEKYRNEYIKGRIGVGYDIRAGILGMPFAPPKKARAKKSSEKKVMDAKKLDFKVEEVKKLILLKAKTEKEESCVITEKDLEHLGQKNIKILNISNKGTITDLVGDKLLQDIKKGKTCVPMPKLQVNHQQQQIGGSSEMNEEQYSTKTGRQYKVFHVPAEYVEYLKENSSEVIEDTNESSKDGTEVIQILDERETAAEVTENSDNDYLQIWEQLSNDHSVLVCSVDPNSRRQADVLVDGSSSEDGQVEFIIAN